MVQSIFTYIEETKQRSEEINRQQQEDKRKKAEIERLNLEQEHARQEKAKQAKHDAIQKAYEDFLQQLKNVSDNSSEGKALVDNLIAKAQKLTQSNVSDERLENISKIMQWAINGFENNDSDEQIKTAVAKEISSDITYGKIFEWLGCIALSVLVISVGSPLTYIFMRELIQGGDPNLVMGVFLFPILVAHSICALVSALIDRPVPNLGGNIAAIDSYLALSQNLWVNN